MRRRALALPILGVVLFAGLPAAAQEALAKSFITARQTAAAWRPAGAVATRARAAEAGFVPAGCTVESWCLIKATECFLGKVTRPTGLWQAFAQYSVVRRAVALCPSGPYGQWQRHNFLGPVEPQVFSSAVETEEKTASEAAVKLCLTYRADWVEAAPRCGG